MIVSMVILRFTINFTMSEEFREIGVMKAIGITNGRIRLLYILKYFAIAVMGSAIGFGISFPFGSLMIQNLSRNVIVSNGGYFVLNIICAILTAAAVVGFCYFCFGIVPCLTLATASVCPKSAEPEPVADAESVPLEIRLSPNVSCMYHHQTALHGGNSKLHGFGNCFFVLHVLACICNVRRKSSGKTGFRSFVGCQYG